MPFPQYPIHPSLHPSDDVHPKFLRERIESAVIRTLHAAPAEQAASIQSFEQSITQWTGVEHAVGLSSGSDAITVALMTMGIGPGDEVLTTAFGSFAPLSAITRTGAKPVFLDLAPNTYVIDLNRIEAAVSPRTRAIIASHSLGNQVQMRALNRLARDHDLLVIEDATQAFGCRQGNLPLGAFGHIACFDFGPDSSLSAPGQSGMLVTDDTGYAMIARSLRGDDSSHQPEGRTHRRELPDQSTPCSDPRGQTRLSRE